MKRLVNDEALMTNDEGMTKSEDRNVRAEDSFWDEEEWFVKSRRRSAFTTWKSERRNSVKQLSTSQEGFRKTQ
jgi:hypothetical protein